MVDPGFPGTTYPFVGAILEVITQKIDSRIQAAIKGFLRRFSQL